MAPLETIEIPAADDTIYVNGLPYALSGNTYTAPYDSLVIRSELFSGNTPIRHGFRLQLFNDNVITLDQSKSGFDGINGTEAIVTFSTLKDNRYPQNNGIIITQ